jgi:putative aminopeptidase FrvX
MELLKQLCSVRATSGDEKPMTDFLLNHINTDKVNWKTQPVIHAGENFQDCIVLAFGSPKTAIFAHIDSIGFTVRYDKELVKIGSPRTENGYSLVGNDTEGEIECTLRKVADGDLSYVFHRKIERGTPLSFKPNFIETEESVQCCYMDNRLGVYVALEVAKTLENGIIVFSCYEEHGGGTVGFLAQFILQQYKVSQALICDITWVTNGVQPGYGVAISMRDSLIPRRSFLNRIIKIAKQSNIPFQLEVENAGGSDGAELQHSPIAFDWCFIGAPEENVHTPYEKVNKKDIISMTELYKMLMKEL